MTVKPPQRSTVDALVKGRTAVIESGSPGFAGLLNIYVCNTCRGHIVTRDKERGVTPFAVRCYAKEGCVGSMKSSMYRVFDQDMLESHQWVRPEPTDILDSQTLDHVSKGGLILRPRPSE